MTTTDVMTGFPPASENLVTLENWRTDPFNKWSLHHVRELLPTAPVGADPASTTPLKNDSNLSLDFAFDHNGGVVTLSDVIERTHVDGFLVLHRDQILVEEYRNGMTPSSQHILF